MVQTPAVTVTLDGSSMTASEAAVTGVRVDLGMGAAHDRFRIALARISPFASGKPGAQAEIELGGDSPTKVITGTVTQLERRPWGFVLEGLSSTSSLSDARVGKSFVRQKMEAIVKALIQAAGVNPGEIAAPVKLAAYHVDERRSVWSHLQELGQLAAIEISSDPDGGLNFRPVKRATESGFEFRHGAEVIDWDIGFRKPAGPAPSVVPFGTGSEQGEDKWHLLLKEPAGGGSAQGVTIPAALRDREGASALQEGMRREAIRQTKTGSLVVAGEPGVRAGDIVELKDMPSGEDGAFRVTEVTHELGSSTGFRSMLKVEAAE